MERWFERNIPSLSEDECRLLCSKTVCIAGCGGLGGYLAELSARCGIGGIILCDGDSFEITNMNRQIGCTLQTLSSPKAEVIGERLLSINPSIRLSVLQNRLSTSTAHEALCRADVVLDGLDSAAGRIMLGDSAASLGLSVIHGAVSAWGFQVSTVPPGSGILKRLYGSAAALPEPVKSCLSFAPSACASIQVSEAVKLLLGKECSLTGKVFFADLKSFTFETVII